MDAKAASISPRIFGVVGRTLAVGPLPPLPPM